MNILIVNLFCQDTLKAVLIKDINPFSSTGNSSYPENFKILNDKLIFIATTSQYNEELWYSDGTNEGTQLLKDINPDIQSDVSGMTIWNDKMIFSADDGIHGGEPWITDGTEINTRMIKDIVVENKNISGSKDGSEPRYFTVFNNKVFFQAGYSCAGTQLFVTDGTEEGTIMLTETGTGDRNPSGFTEFHNKLFFSCQNNMYAAQLWVTDGTPDSTYEFKVFGNGYNGRLFSFFPIIYKDKLYFSAAIDSIGNELWVSDGTMSGTVLFKDINSIYGQGSFIHDFTILNNNLYFIADDGIHGNELWCTNGDSTYLVKDINPNGGGLNYSKLKVLNGKLYFDAQQHTNGPFELWVSNGTADSTLKVLANDSTSIIDPKLFIEWKGKIVFVAGEYNKQLWITDGTQKNTHAIFSDVYVHWNALGYSSSLVEYKGDIYFNASYNDSIGVELYKLTVDSSLIRPNIIKQPISDTICAGDSIIFEVKVTGRPDFIFQWFKNDIPIDNATDSIYKIPNAEIQDSGSYACLIKNSVGEIMSNYAYLKVYKLSSQFEVDESIQTGVYSIKYTGDAPESAVYNWDFDGGEIVSGFGQGPYQIKWNGSGQKVITLSVSLNSCVSDTTRAIIIISSIKTDVANPTVSIYPIPVESNLILNFSQSGVNKFISLSDVNGHILIKKQTVENNLNLNLSNMESGVYYVKIQIGAKCIVKEIIKQ